jgi:hypothetical protein
MIDTADFKALDPQTQLSALQNAMAKNINMPVNVNNIGTAKKISKDMNGSAKDT